MFRKAEQKIRKARHAIDDAKETIKQKVIDQSNILILKNATAESRHMSEQRFHAVSDKYTYMNNQRLLNQERWNAQLNGDTSEQAQSIRNELEYFKTESDGLKEILDQIQVIVTQMDQRPSDGSCSATSAKNDCERMLSQQVMLEEQSFNPKHTVLVERMNANAAALSNLTPPVTVTTELPSQTISPELMRLASMRPRN